MKLGELIQGLLKQADKLEDGANTEIIQLYAGTTEDGYSLLLDLTGGANVKVDPCTWNKDLGVLVIEKK